MVIMIKVQETSKEKGHQDEEKDRDLRMHLLRSAYIS